MEKNRSEDDMMDAIAVIQEALIDLYLNVKVRSKDEISDYDEDDLLKERENLLMTSPLDLINYIQTSVEILMNIKVEDFIAHRKEVERK
jgi:protein associated with RNAse G/E